MVSRSRIAGPGPAKTDMTHMQIVTWLKGTHGLGHGHANALVAHVKAETTKKDRDA